MQRPRAFLVQIWLRVRHIIWEMPTEPLELFLGISAIGYGAWLMLPADTFGNAPGYAAMRGTAISEILWGTIFVASGFSTLIALFTQNRILRRWSSFVASLLWLFIDAQIARSNFWGTGTVIYFHIWLISATLYLRFTLGKEAHYG